MHRLPLVLAIVAAPAVVLAQRTPVLHPLPLVAHAESLDTLAREPMLVEHPGGTLFVSGYNRVRPRLWKSADGGASWKSVDVGTRAQGAIGNSDLSLAVAPDGTLYLAVLTYDPGKGEGVQVAVGASRDVGATWHWTTVSHARFDDRPWIATTPNGSAHLVWNNDRGVWHSAESRPWADVDDTRADARSRRIEPPCGGTARRAGGAHHSRRRSRHAVRGRYRHRGAEH